MLASHPCPASAVLKAPHTTLHVMRKSSPTHRISKRLHCVTREKSPVSSSMFIDALLRSLVWNGWQLKVAGRWVVCAGVFMPCSVPASFHLLNIQICEFRI